jgi:hypothetical protein
MITNYMPVDLDSAGRQKIHEHKSVSVHVYLDFGTAPIPFIAFGGLDGATQFLESEFGEPISQNEWELKCGLEPPKHRSINTVPAHTNYTPKRMST